MNTESKKQESNHTRETPGKCIFITVRSILHYIWYNGNFYNKAYPLMITRKNNKTQKEKAKGKAKDRCGKCMLHYLQRIFEY